MWSEPNYILYLYISVIPKGTFRRLCYGVICVYIPVLLTVLQLTQALIA